MNQGLHESLYEYWTKGRRAWKRLRFSRRGSGGITLAAGMGVLHAKNAMCVVTRPALLGKLLPFLPLYDFTLAPESMGPHDSRPAGRQPDTG